MSSSPNVQVAIVGGGISGLAAAYYLSKRGIDSTVIEARPYLGGLLRTERIEGCTVEAGADSWLASKSAAAALAHEVGLGPEIIGSNDRIRKTFILKRGKLLPYPEGMQLIAPTRLGPVWRSRLFSFRTKARMTADWLRPPPGKAPPERSVARFVGEHFGREAVDYVADPLLTGIYGGNADELSASSALPKLVQHERVHGSLVRGLRAGKPTGSVFQSLGGGLGSLADRLQPRSVIHGRVEQITRAEDCFELRVNAELLTVGHLILACESHEAARLLSQVDPVLAGQLGEIRHSSGHIAAFGFRREEMSHPLNGFGFLVPKCEGGSLMACTWVTSKFPERASAGIALLRAFFRETPRDSLAELRSIMGVSGEPLFSRMYEWPSALAQYRVGHAARVEAIEARALCTRGLHLIGNAYHGVGIPDCIQLAKAVTERIAL